MAESLVRKINGVPVPAGMVPGYVFLMGSTDTVPAGSFGYTDLDEAFEWARKLASGPGSLPYVYVAVVLLDEKGRGKLWRDELNTDRSGRLPMYINGQREDNSTRFVLLVPHRLVRREQ